MPSNQEILTSLAHDAVQQVVDSLPGKWRQAELRVLASVVQQEALPSSNASDEIELEIRIFNPVDPAQMTIEAAPAVIDALSELYIAHYDGDDKWNLFSAVMDLDASGNWTVETCFQLEKNAAAPATPRPLSTRFLDVSPPPGPEMSPELEELFARHAALSLEKNLAFDSLFAEEVDWEFDARTAKLMFGDVTYDIQVLGVFSEASSQWRWAWDCPGGTPPESLQAALRVRAVGEKLNIPEFTQPVQDSETADPETLAMTACGICGAGFWFECEHDGQSMFVLGDSADAAARLSDRPKSIVAVVYRLIASFDVRHQAAVQSFLVEKGYRLAYDTNRTTASNAAGNRLTATFQHGRLRDLTIQNAGETGQNRR